MLNSLPALRGIAMVLMASLVLAATSTFANAQGIGSPSDLIAQASAPGDLAISLFWNDNSLEEDGFEIQRSVGINSVDFVTIDMVFLNNIGSYNDVGLDEHTTYNYRVRAFNATSVSGFSNISSAMTSYAQPIQVSGLQGERTNRLVLLTWVDASDNETRFEVERAEVGVSTEFAIIATLAPDTTSYVDDTALDGAVYDYRVRPWRFDVAGGAPDFVTITMGPGIAPPTSVRAKPESRSKIALSWKRNSDKNVSVQIQRFNLDTALWSTIAQVSSGNSEFKDTGLVSQTTYSYRLRNVSATAVSPWVEAFATTK